MSLGSALRDPRLTPFWPLQTALSAGEYAFGAVVLWSVYRLTGSAAWLGAAAVVSYLPAVAAGVVGPDRARASRHQVTLCLGRAAAAGLALAAVVTLGRDGAVAAALVLTGALVEESLAASQVPLLQTALVRTVSAAGLAPANAGMEFAIRIGQLAGPGLAGWILGGPGPGAAFGAAAALFCLAAPAARRFQVLAAPAPTVRRHRPPAAGLAEAWPPLRKDRFLAAALATRALTNLLYPAVTLGLPVLVVARWHTGAAGYGLLLTAFGAGSLCGAAVAAGLSLTALRPAFFAAWTVTGLCLWAYGAGAPYAAALALQATIGAGGPVVHVAMDSHIGATVGRSRLTAVFGVQRLVMNGLAAGGSALMGALLGGPDTDRTLMVSGLLMVAITLAGAGAAGIRGRRAAAAARQG